MCVCAHIYKKRDLIFFTELANSIVKGDPKSAV